MTSIVWAVIAKREGIACRLVAARSFARLSSKAAGVRAKIIAGIISVPALRMGLYVCLKFVRIALDVGEPRAKSIGAKTIRINSRIQRRQESGNLR